MIDRIFIFAKAQVSSFVGGIVDYIVMITFTEFLHLHYTLSIVIGGVVGAIVNFSINRFWTFRSKSRPYRVNGTNQLLRFAVVVLNSILLKTSGTFFITTYFKTDYIISRLVTDLTVSWMFNYMLQRHWVFKKKPALHE